MLFRGEVIFEGSNLFIRVFEICLRASIFNSSVWRRIMRCLYFIDAQTVRLAEDEVLYLFSNNWVRHCVYCWRAWCTRSLGTWTTTTCIRTLFLAHYLSFSLGLSPGWWTTSSSKTWVSSQRLCGLLCFSPKALSFFGKANLLRGVNDAQKKG